MKDEVARFFATVKEARPRMAVFLAALVLLSSCADGDPPGPRSATKVGVYDCGDGYSFVASVEEEGAWLFLPGQTVLLPLLPSGSGARYGDGSIEFRSKGEEATLVAGGDRRRCVNDPAGAIWEGAKLRGVHFRAAGNEPGWFLEFGEEILLVTDYGAARHRFPLPEPETDRSARTTTYLAEEDGHELRVLLEGRPCTDSMSGESFETTVEVEFDGRVLRGCGRALY